MRRPTISVVLTLNDRPQEAIRNVLTSLIPQPYDKLVVVFDRTPATLADYVEGLLWSDDRAEIIRIDGDLGWLCPAKAWNTGFSHVSTELVYCISSEVIQEPGNINRAIDILATKPAIVFGACTDDGEAPLVQSDRPNVLCDSKMPRPLGFIWAGPTWALRATGGFDEKFMEGYWYDDDDFFYRLWKLGLPFLFDDGIRGVHQHHERPALETLAGRSGVIKNRAHILAKHGTDHPLTYAPKTVWSKNGQTWWEQPRGSVPVGGPTGS